MSHNQSQDDTLKVSDDTTEVSDMEQKSQRERIIALKKAKEERQYTIQRIKDEVLRNGDSISESTLKREFAPGSENDTKEFSDYSLIVVEKVLLQPEELPVPDESPYASEIGLLQAELRVQSIRVESLLEHNKFLEDRIDFLMEQIKIKDRRMDEREQVLNKLMTERDTLRKRLEELNGKG